MTQAALAVPQFFYCSEVATEIRRTEAAVRWLWHSGALRSRLVGGRRVSTADDIAAFFESGEA